MIGTTITGSASKSVIWFSYTIIFKEVLKAWIVYSAVPLEDGW